MTDTYQSLAEELDSYPWPDELDGNSLLAAVSAITGLPPESVGSSVVEDCVLEAAGETNEALEMRPGGWRVKVTSTLVKAAIATGLMAGILSQAGFDQLPTYILPAVLPLIIDVEQAKLSRQQRALLLQLRAHAGNAAGVAVQPDVLYNRLPASVRGDISLLDFCDFMQALIETGHADDAGYTDVRLRRADHPAWIRITWE